MPKKQTIPDVICPSCKNSCIPGKHKAPLIKGIACGATAGAASGGTIGAKVGAGTGIATGGTGFAGMPIFLAIGAGTGAAIGGISGAWYRDKRLQCPTCTKVFKNPLN